MTWDPRQPPSPPPPPPGGYYNPAPPPVGQGYYAGPYGQPPLAYVQSGQRPTSATVLAIVGIVLASVALLNHGAGLILRATNSRLMGNIPGQSYTWMMLDSVISGLLWLAALIGCIGLLRNSTAARKGMLAWAGAYLLWLVVCAIVAVTVTVPATIQQAQGRRPEFEQAAYFGAVCFMVILAVYPVLILSMLTRPHVVAAYDGAGR